MYLKKNYKSYWRHLEYIKEGEWMVSNQELVLRLVLSAIIGGLIGIEREANNRPAGLRTHMLVTLGSALIMLLSIYGFNGLNSSGDPARLAAQVVSGIGFLGAGTILRNGNKIKGLTTAASIWVCAAVGLAIGSGYYLGALASAAIVLFTLMGLGILEKKLFRKKYISIIVQGKGRPGLIGDIGHAFGRYDIAIKDIQIRNNTDEYEYEKEDSNAAACMVEEEGLIDIHFAVKLCSAFNRSELILEIENINSVEQVIWNDEGYTYNANSN